MDLEIIQWNANGIRAHGHELKALIRLKKMQPHVIAIQESKLSPKATYTLPGYTMHNRDRDQAVPGARGGGLLLLVRNDCNSSHIPVEVGNLETQMISIDLANGKVIRLANVYHRIATPTNINELNKLSQALGPDGIILGDFNAHNPLWGESEKLCKHGTDIQNWMEDKNLVLLNDGSYTRIDTFYDSWSSLDLTFATTSLAHLTQWQVHDDTWGSDHLPTITHLGSPPKTEELQTRAPSWNFNKADWNLFQTQCLNIQENTIVSDDPNVFCQNLTQAITDAANLAIPLTSTGDRKGTVPWWSKEIHMARAKRKKAINRSKRDKSAFQLVRETRQEVKTLIKDSKKANWYKFCQNLNSKANSKEVWNKIKAVRGTRKATPIPRLKSNSTLKGKANALATHYAKVSSNQNYSPTFRETLNTDSDPPKQEPHVDLAINEPFNTEELTHAIASKRGTAPGEDMLSYVLFKHMPTPTLDLLTRLFNLIWEKGDVPSSWKHALVIPIHKMGKDPKEESSYRPVSLTSHMCKSMEAMVTRRLNHHLETGGHISPDQSGFRKGHSTTDHIVRLEHEIRMAQLQKKYLAAIFLDFSKAFDMVWHNGVLQKLANKGVKGRMANFIQSFLKNRSLSVRVGTTISDTMPLQNGTPQGSIISPTLFNIMIDDLFEEVGKQVSTAKYADDGTLWISHRNPVHIRSQLQRSLSVISKWCDKWGFTLSSEKTVAVVFKRIGMEPISPSLTIQGKAIQYKKHARFLGVIFDEHLTWSKHIHDVVIRCKKDLNVLRALTGTEWGASKETLLILYRSLVRSKLDYGCEAIDPKIKLLSKSLDSIQYQALRIATGAVQGTALATLLADTGELPLDLRREQLTLNYWSRTDNALVRKTWEMAETMSRLNLAMTRTKWQRPFGLRVNQLVAEHKCQNLKSTDSGSVRPAQWKLKTPTVDTSLTSLVDKDLNPTQAKVLALEKIENQWTGWGKVYTDGSKNPDTRRTGYGIFVEGPAQARISHRLPDGQSVFTAELQAIYESLRTLPEITNHRDVVILSDSLSALQAIQGKRSKARPKLLDSLLERYTSLTADGYTIQLCWIPSHVGLAGNEGADKLARDSLTLPNPTTDLRYSSQEIKSHIRESVERKWNVRWQSHAHGRWFHNLRPTVPNRTRDKPRLSRHSEVVIRRLRYGVTKLSHFVCTQCNTAQNVTHLLLHCPEYDTQRHLLRPVDTPVLPDVPDILNTDNNAARDRLQDYLDATGLRDRI